MHNHYSPSGDSPSLCRKLSLHVQGGSNMTGTDVARFTHKQSRSYLNHLVDCFVFPAVSSLVFLGAVNLNAMSRLAPTFIS